MFVLKTKNLKNMRLKLIANYSIELALGNRKGICNRDRVLEEAR